MRYAVDGWTSEAGASPLDATAAIGGDFYAQASAELGGVVSGVENTAISTINGWRSDAQNAVLGLLDRDQTKLLNLGIQGAQAIEAGGGQFNQQTFFAVAGLAAASIGGPVAGALVGSLMVTLDAMKGAAIALMNSLGVPQAHGVNVFADFRCVGGWPKNAQIVPGGPSDPGDGTYQNPGWQSTWPQLLNTLGPCLDCTSMASTIVPGGGWAPGGQDRDACSRALPAYLNGSPAIGSDDDAQPWCELQQVPRSDFLWFFYQLWYTNRDFSYNCSPIAPVDDQLLLLQAARVWNAGHSGSSTVTYAAGFSDAFPTADQIRQGGVAVLKGTVPGTRVRRILAQPTGLPPLIVNTGAPVNVAASSGGGASTLRLRGLVYSPALASVDRAMAAKASATKNAGKVSPVVLAAGAVAALALFRPKVMRGLLRSIGVR